MLAVNMFLFSTTFSYKSEYVTVISEIYAMFLLLQVMRLSENCKNKNLHSYFYKLHLQTGFLQIA